MPRGDKTGPQGFGPMTGRAMGFCTGNDSAGFENPPMGRGYGRGRGSIGGRGRGFGRGMGRGYGQGRAYGGRWENTGNRNWDAEDQIPGNTMNKDEELSYLKDRQKYHERNLRGIQKRRSELEGE